MTARPDDDALRWEGDDDLPPRPDPASALPRGWRAVGTGAGEAASVVPDTDADAPDADAPEAAPLGNVALVALGLLAGVYLLYTIGWFLGGARLRESAAFLVADAAYLPAYIVAVLAPALWFGVTTVLTRGAASWLRFAWLAAGVVLLVPWPFVLFGAVA